MFVLRLLDERLVKFSDCSVTPLSLNDVHKSGPNRWKKQPKKFKERSNRHSTDIYRVIIGTVF